LSRVVTAAIAVGKRPVPFRTRKLSPPAPMVLPGGPGGRVGRGRTNFHSRPRQVPVGAYCCLRAPECIDCRAGSFGAGPAGGADAKPAAGCAASRDGGRAGVVSRLLPGVGAGGREAGAAAWPCCEPIATGIRICPTGSGGRLRVLPSDLPTPSASHGQSADAGSHKQVLLQSAQPPQAMSAPVRACRGSASSGLRLPLSRACCGMPSHRYPGLYNRPAAFKAK
jgi:hypothetical protein